MSPARQKYVQRNRKLLPFAFIAMLLAGGAGAASGLILEDSITGTTGNNTIAVSQALAITAIETSGGDSSFGVIDDNGLNFAAHYQANNGDKLTLAVNLTNQANTPIYYLLTITNPNPELTLAVEGSGNPVVMAGENTWASVQAANETSTLTITIIIANSAASGLYELAYEIEPVEV